MKKPASKNRQHKNTMPKRMPKNQKKTWHVWGKLIISVRKGMYASQIARQLGLDRRKVEYHLKKMQAAGLVALDTSTSCKIYTLTDSGQAFLEMPDAKKLSVPTTKKRTRLHTLRIRFPIIKDNPRAKFEKEYKLNNWIQRYTTIKFPIGITIRKTTKNIEAIFHQFETATEATMTDFFSWVMRGTYYVYYFMMNQLGIQIDIFSAEITQQHLANEDPDLLGETDTKQTTRIGLNRKAQGFLPTNIDAAAWLDYSQGKDRPDWETNDFLYQERLLLMPETVHQMGKAFMPAIEQLTQQINLHLEVQRETLKTLKSIRRGVNGKAKRDPNIPD